MSTHKSIKPELKARLEKALRENLRKRKAQQRDRKLDHNPDNKDNVEKPDVEKLAIPDLILDHKLPICN